MPLDIPAGAVAGQVIKYARAAWDVARDGGASGTISIPSQQLPAGALILGWLWSVVESFTDLGSSAIGASVGTYQVFDGESPASGPGGAQIGTGYPPAPLPGSLPIVVSVTGDGYSAGSLYVYVFYA